MARLPVFWMKFRPETGPFLLEVKALQVSTFSKWSDSSREGVVVGA